jgi:hypothetical protein
LNFERAPLKLQRVIKSKEKRARGRERRERGRGGRARQLVN